VAQSAINDERLEDLLSRTALNLAAHAEQSATACDGRVEHWHDVSLCDARSPHWYRNVATLRRRLRADESLELHRRLVEFYGSPSTWVVATVFPLDVADGALVNHLSEELMYEPGGGAVQVRHPDLRIREAANGRDMEDFERVWASSYGHKHLLEPDAVRYDERVIGNGHHIFVGYVDDQAVTTAISYIHDGINLIRGVTTLPQYRGRGIASAMTAHAMSTTDLPRVLNAEPGVENIYRRLGFQTISTFSFWSSQSRLVTYG
jgi:GNAT superfamily N-acetyltransferase